MMRRNWMIVIPAAILVWGVLEEKVSLMLLAVAAYFALAWYVRRGPIGRLASVPASTAVPQGNLPSNGSEGERIGSSAGVPINGSC